MLATCLLGLAVELRRAGSGWVVGDRFFNRRSELTALVERCHEGIHTLLTAQRRMGKTSLVRELLRCLETSGEFETAFVDLEGASTPADAIADIWNEVRTTQGLLRRARHRLGAFGRRIRGQIESLEAADIRIKLRASVNAGNWQHRGESILTALAGSDKPVVLALDEFPILVNRLLKGIDYEITPERRQATDEFLSWLRKVGQRHQGEITLILTGSVGLKPILRQAGLTTHTNIFSPYELQPWDEQTARDCLRALAETYHLVLSEGVCHDICRRLRCCVPHHVQQFFAYVHDHLRRTGRTEATLADIDHVYTTTMLSVRGQIDMEHYEDRLKVVLGPEAYPTGLALLAEAAVSDGWLHHRTVALYVKDKPDSELPGLIDHVLYVLEHDGYFTRHPDGYRFTSGLLEDWWRVRYGQHFVPLTEPKDRP